MDIFGVLALLGGLAIFLYGMDLLGEGLTGASGGKLENILEKLTSNPIKAVLLGAGVTAVIQSSSDRKSTRLNSSHMSESRMPSSA